MTRATKSHLTTTTMARQLLLSEGSGLGPGVGLMSLFLCVAALFMCASHSRKWRQWKACYEPDTEDYSPPVIQHIGHGNDDVDEHDDVAPVWQRNILMGGKCELPDFSGVIIYDSNGSVVTPTKNPRLLLPWK